MGVAVALGWKDGGDKLEGRQAVERPDYQDTEQPPQLGLPGPGSL